MPAHNQGVSDGCLCLKGELVAKVLRPAWSDETSIVRWLSGCRGSVHYTHTHEMRADRSYEEDDNEQEPLKDQQG